MNGMRAYIICHMLSSADRKIDGNALQQVAVKGEYEAVTTKTRRRCMGLRPRDMQQQFAEDEPFVSASNTPAGPRPIHVARQSESSAISFNPVGSLRWSGGDLDGDHLICVVSERAPPDYRAASRNEHLLHRGWRVFCRPCSSSEPVGGAFRDSHVAARRRRPHQ